MSEITKMIFIYAVAALAITFLVLKLSGSIDWSWWLVLAPIWIGALVFIGAIVIGILRLGKAQR
jgi:hypothetical protein